MKYNIIGDVHGRKNAIELFDPAYINIYVGDYFDPYLLIPWEEQKEIFDSIINLKKQYPNTILLEGNHDVRYLFMDDSTSRFNYEHAKDIKALLEENHSLFQCAYSIENKYLVTHAGVSARWYANKVMHLNNCNFYVNGRAIPTTIIDIDEGWQWLMNNWHNPNRKPECNELFYFQHSWWVFTNHWNKLEVNPNVVADNVNILWNTNKYSNFNFRNNSYDPYDCYGESVSHSPQWIRMESLTECNIFKGTKYIQVFGHTNSKDFQYVPNEFDPILIMVDCLGSNKKSYKIDLDD